MPAASQLSKPLDVGQMIAGLRMPVKAILVNRAQIPYFLAVAIALHCTSEDVRRFPWGDGGIVPAEQGLERE